MTDTQKIMLALLKMIERKCPLGDLDPEGIYLLSRLTGSEIARIRETISQTTKGGTDDPPLKTSPVPVAGEAGGGAEARRLAVRSLRRGKPLPVQFDVLSIGSTFEFAQKSSVAAGKYNGTFRKINATEYRGQGFKATPEPFVLVIPGPLELRPGLCVFVDAHGEHGENFSGVLLSPGEARNAVNVIAPDGEVYLCARSHTYPASQSYVERFIAE